MKVIFIQDVVNVARRDEVKEVSNGYALNYLLPRGLAVRSSSEKLKALEQHTLQREREASKNLAQVSSWAGQLTGRKIIISSKANEEGTLYASVTAQQVADIIKTQLGVPVKVEQVEFKQHLKTIGDYVIVVKLGADLKVNISLTIKPENNAQ